MVLPKSIVDFLLTAEQKALATQAADGPHVVPVSSVLYEDDQVILIDYFMSKTVTNITEHPSVALAFWSGLAGYQLKGTVQYETSGAVFEQAVAFAAERFPDRTVTGVLRITPTVVYDISASTERPTTPLVT
ncbi:pyridoxamine 5'-phosphate oxidase family protein [Candidatus Kaiserbacteria bacterium]|nr:pyridoxamine 5'-phosphate oxidase family protein [Candidatus Kaiserbacteria bacterium]